MSRAVSKCPKCQGEMVCGFIMDYTSNFPTVSTWVNGLPRKMWWPLYWGGIKTPERKEMIPVGTFRCQACGFLESYAREEFAPK